MTRALRLRIEGRKSKILLKNGLPIMLFEESGLLFIALITSIWTIGWIIYYFIEEQMVIIYWTKYKS